jgi:hypothetical protein
MTWIKEAHRGKRSNDVGSGVVRKVRSQIPKGIATTRSTTHPIHDKGRVAIDFPEKYLSLPKFSSA